MCVCAIFLFGGFTTVLLCTILKNDACVVMLHGKLVSCVFEYAHVGDRTSAK